MSALFCFSLFFWQCSVYTRAYDMHLSSQKTPVVLVAWYYYSYRLLWLRRYYIKLTSSSSFLLALSATSCWIAGWKSSAYSELSLCFYKWAGLTLNSIGVEHCSLLEIQKWHFSYCATFVTPVWYCTSVSSWCLMDEHQFFTKICFVKMNDIFPLVL